MEPLWLLCKDSKVFFWLRLAQSRCHGVGTMYGPESATRGQALTAGGPG